MTTAQELQGHWNQIRGKVREKWGQLTDDDLQVGSGNLDQVIGRIQQRTGEQRANIQKFIEGLIPSHSTIESATGKAAEFVSGAAQNVRDTAEKAASSLRENAGTAAQAVRDGAGTAYDSMSDAYEQGQQLVRHNPGTSVATVFAVGVLAGVGIGLLLNSK